MKKTEKIIGILWIFTILATFGLTYHLATSTKSNIKKDYVLKTQYDSLMRVVNADEEEIKDLKESVDSIIHYSVKQQNSIDSLSKAQHDKKVNDAKKYTSIGSMSDDEQNAILSDKLK